MIVIIKYIGNNIILFSKACKYLYILRLDITFRVVVHRTINITEKSSGNMEGYRTKQNLNFRPSLNSAVIKNNHAGVQLLSKIISAFQ